MDLLDKEKPLLSPMNGRREALDKYSIMLRPDAPPVRKGGVFPKKEKGIE